jgi:hypothetical protein
LLCGGPPDENGKIRQHAFHISCWRKAILHSSDGLARELYVSPLLIGSKSFAKKEIGGETTDTALTWSDLNDSEQEQVKNEFEKPE